MNPLWKVYKTKVMKTLRPDSEDAEAESSEPDGSMTPVEEDEGPGAMTQLARKVQGAGSRGWKSMSALFNKDDEHQLLESEGQPTADHPLAVKPEEPRPNKRSTGFWDAFATKWQQEASAKQASAAEEGVACGEEAQAEAGEAGGRGQEREGQQEGEESEEGGGGGVSGNSFSNYATLGGGGEESGFKWNFVTSKLAELKSKSLAKTN